MNIKSVRIEDWNGAAAIRISDELLESLAVELGDTIYIIEERADGVVRQILSKTPLIPDRADDMCDELLLKLDTVILDVSPVEGSGAPVPYTRRTWSKG